MTSDVCCVLLGRLCRRFQEVADFGHPDTAEAHSRLGESLYKIALAKEAELTSELLQAYEHFNLGAHTCPRCAHHWPVFVSVSTLPSAHTYDDS